MAGPETRRKPRPAALAREDVAAMIAEASMCAETRPAPLRIKTYPMKRLS